ncbi:MAG: dipeptide epimerase [Thermoprotei archaeon]|nr:MAG: dipeptide epimerase [Thermoprotei archaeon]
MRIRDIRTRVLELKLRSVFRTALGEEELAKSVLVFVETGDGAVGIGEASPAPRVTGEDVSTVVEVIEKVLKPRVVGLEVEEFRRIWLTMERCIEGNYSAKAGIDIAVHDLLGKVLGRPLWRLLGGLVSELETDITVSLDRPEVMAEEARVAVEKGFRVLKLKLGLDPKLDVERVRAVRDAVGYDVRLRVDANQGWSPKQAVWVLSRIERFEIECVEQPVPEWCIDGLKYVRERVEVPVIADESAKTVRDVAHLAKLEAVDGVNVKLMKCGGITPALDIVSVARSHDLMLMFGCMLETRVSITAAASVASYAQPEFIDLDAPLSIVHEPIKGGVEYVGPRMKLPLGPGLGVEVIEWDL